MLVSDLEPIIAIVVNVDKAVLTYQVFLLFYTLSCFYDVRLNIL